MRRQCVAVSVVSIYILGGSLGAQTLDVTQLKNLDLTRKGTILFRTSSSLPATCVPGEALLRTDAKPGMNLYVCLSANKWVAQMNGVASIERGGTGQMTRGAASDAPAPSAAKGDTIVFDGQTNRRVGAGPDGSCWIADSTQAAGVRWGSCSGVTSGAGLALAGTVLSIDSATVPTFLTGAASLTFGNLSNGSCGARTFSLTGAATGDGVAPGWPASLEPGLLGTIRVSAADTIEVRLCNLSGTAITPSAGQTFRATIVRGF